MKAHDLQPTPGSRRARKRIGRGISAGQGKTSGRGQKGQGSRSSVGIPTSFEGGQMPLAQRLPKLRGFNNVNRREFAIVNLGKLNRFEAGTEVNPEMLQQTGLVRKRLGGVKILAAGKLKIALKVSAHRVSAGAWEAIEKAGGSVELIGPQSADKVPRRHKDKDKPKPQVDEPKSKTRAKAGTDPEPAVEGSARTEAAQAAEGDEEAEVAGGAEPEADGGEAESSPKE